ncbi:hypothetical protein TRFO_18374 [Tritrichomonas foetus]|uniref:MMS19 nucleotide excision repair protein n=1 Tax=Tritrichomonas foetus TaxID=1144522 RepID=A0A1J4KR89_9EUKA|nr:hypothetical protein TRFO_18374 [Tritrichomonas foetus]|eukprot:OHT11989.1 hypothetical protein TRFO_18374 [Tritrichomonas foetus]
MENSKSSFFLQILQDLSSKSASIRYHSQYALRSFSAKDSATVINEFAEYFRSVSTLEPRILNELTYLIKNLHQDDKSGLGGLHSIFQSIEKLCHNAQTITCSIELLNLCETFFTTFPDLFFRLCDPSKNMPIVTTLTASQFISINPKSSNITSSSHSIHTSNSTSDSTSKFAIVEHADLFLEKNDDSIFFKYASVLFLSALFPFSSRLSPNSLKIYKLKSLEFINFFLNKPIDAFSQYFPILLPLNFPDDPNECSEMLRKLSIISRENPKIAHFLIPSLLSLLGNSFAEADIEIVIESLLPTLSLIPFHFSSSLPDESVVDGFKMAVQAV